MEELLGRYYLAETALFYSGFELNEKKRKTAFFKADKIKKFPQPGHQKGFSFVCNSSNLVISKTSLF